MTNIAADDFGHIRTRCQGRAVFQQALEGAREGDQLLRLLWRYTVWNGAFAPAVAGLVSGIGLRPDLFQDPEEPLLCVADRAAEVASSVFMAAIEEYAMRETHRALAQATLKGAVAFLGYDTARVNALLCDRKLLDESVAAIRRGYGIVQRDLTEQEIFQCLGFHAGSESLADDEFNFLDQFLREHHPALVAYLMKREVGIGAVTPHKQNTAYTWVAVHTTVEADHYQAALRASDRALRFYAGGVPRDQVRAWVFQGFEGFARAQEEFLRRLAN